MLGVDLPSFVAVLWFFFINVSRLFSVEATAFCITTSNTEGFLFLNSLIKFTIFLFS